LDIQFACYAQAAIAEDEYRAWANADSVADYLWYFSDFAGGHVALNAKLAGYWRSRRIFRLRRINPAADGLNTEDFGRCHIIPARSPSTNA
jgi:hypothetical protein